MSAHRGEVICEVVTAKVRSLRAITLFQNLRIPAFQPIDDATLREVTGALQGFVKGSQKLQVSTRVSLLVRPPLILVTFSFFRSIHRFLAE